MKKNTFTLGLGILLLGANAQTAKISSPHTKKHTDATLTVVGANKTSKFSTIENSTNHTKKINHGASTMATIWSDDFSNAATWTLTPGAGTTANWTIGTTAGVGTYSLGVIKSTTAANGFAIFDSDNDCSKNQIANMTNVTPINLTGHANVKLKFQQFYRRDADSARIYVSNDGTNWTNFPINEQYAADGISTNPEVVTVNISSVAGNQATVWIRFTYYSPTSASTWGTYYGPDNGCGYNWLVDDASIEDIYANDLTAMNAYSGASCGAASGGVELVFKNSGFNAASGFPLKYSVNGGAPVVETYTGTVNPGDTVTYLFNTPVSVAAGTPYFVTAYADIASDGDLSDDTAKTAFTGSPFAIPYTTGFEPAAGSLGYNAQHVSGAGSTWAVDTLAPHAGKTDALLLSGVNGASDDWLYTPCLNLTSGKTYQVKYWYACYKFTGTSSTINGGGAIGVAVGDSAKATRMTNVLKPATTTLTATAYAGASTAAAAYKVDSLTFTVATSGSYYVGFEGKNTSGAKQAFLAIDDINVTDLGYTGVKHLVNSSELAIYPNPTTGLLNITTSAVTANVEIYNLMGQIVLSKTITNGTNTVDITNLSNGVYSIQIMQNNTLTVGKIVKAN